MTSRELMRAAMRRQPTERIPCMPQICHDTAIRIEAARTGGDWMDTLTRCIEEPGSIYDAVIGLAQAVQCDGLRLFVKPEPMKVRREGDDLTVVNPRTGDRLGHIDVLGGGGYVPDQPPAPAETLDEAGRRVAEILPPIPDAKIELLRQARARVPDLFVASSPGGITMNSYNLVRGREQAMVDFFERPDFVREVMSLQVEAIVRRAEQLLTTGIDALYIGDPSASASLISPRHFEEFCLPAYQAFCAPFRSRDVLIYIHICGNSRPILEMMADTGAHVIEPLDPLGGVSVADAKRRVGHRVALMGGVNTLTLSTGKPQDVRREAIAACREGGPVGYVLAAGDMVPPETPIENLRALVDVARLSQWK